jgi:hypothetical protein
MRSSWLSLVLLFLGPRGAEAEFAHQEQSFIAFEWGEPHCGWLGIFLK